MGSRDDVVAKALTSHNVAWVRFRCGGICALSFAVDSCLAPRVFLQFFLIPQKPAYTKYNWTRIEDSHENQLGTLNTVI